MALLLLDGFDHYTSTTYAGMASLSASGTAAPGRFGDGRYISINNYLLVPTTSSTTIIYGIAMLGHGNSQGWRVRVGFSPEIDISGNTHSGASLSLKVNGVTWYSISGLIYTDAWNYIEIKVTYHGSNGSVAVRLNGVAVPGLSDKTGVVTGSKPSSIHVAPQSWVSSCYADDYYVCDDTGSVNNDFLGDVRIETLYPTGNGSSTQWARAGTDSGYNWDQVNEDITNDSTDYVTTSGAGYKDLYAMSDLSTSIGGTVLGVQANVRVKKSDSGTRGVAPVFRSGASEADGTEFGTIATNWQWFHDIREDKPGGTGWTVAEVNAMETGIKVTT